MRECVGEGGARNAGAVRAPTAEVGRAQAARGQDGKAGEGPSVGGEVATDENCQHRDLFKRSCCPLGAGYRNIGSCDISKYRKLRYVEISKVAIYQSIGSCDISEYPKLRYIVPGTCIEPLHPLWHSPCFLRR